MSKADSADVMGSATALLALGFDGGSGSVFFSGLK